MIKFVHRANFCRLLRPTARLAQFYSTESTPSVVGKQDKELEVIEEDGKVKNHSKTVKHDLKIRLITITALRDIGIVQYCKSLNKVLHRFSP